MARSPTNLYASASAPTTKTEIVSAEANTTRIIRKMTVCNNSGGALTFDVYIDPTGAAEVQVIDTKSLADMETYSVPDVEGHILNASGTIDFASSGAGLDVIISGIKVT